MNLFRGEPARVLLLAAIAVAVYANTLGYGFVYDDFLWIVDNPAVRGLRGVPRFFTSGHAGMGGRHYRPLVLSWFAIDYAVAGLHSWWYHAENILLHALVTVLVYLLLRSLAHQTAWLTAALFAVLPVHTEVVANVASRSELLAAVLALLALLAWRRPAAAGLLLLLALLAKESVVAVPALAVLLAWRSPEVASPRSRAVAVAVLAAAVCVFVLALYLAVGRLTWPRYPLLQVDNPLAFAAWPARLETALVVLGQNLALCLVPYHLSADYSYAQIPLVAGWSDPRFLGWAGFLLAAIGAVIASLRTRPNIARGIAWFLVAMAPVSNFFLIIGTIRAERVLYLASVGACLAAAELLWLAVASHRRLGIALVTLVLAAQGLVAARRNTVWRSMETVIPATARDAPHSAKAQYDLAALRARSGGCDEAVVSFQRALEIFPDFDRAQLGLAACRERLGQATAAAALYRQVLAAEPGHRLAAAALARLCAERQDWPCVASVLERFLAANAEAAREPGPWTALGNALLSSGRLDEAERAYRRALGSGAGPVAHFNLAGLLARRGRFSEAAGHYGAAERAGMRSEALYEDWANAQKSAGQRAAARETALRGLQRFPGSQALKTLARK